MTLLLMMTASPGGARRPYRKSGRAASSQCGERRAVIGALHPARLASRHKGAKSPPPGARPMKLPQDIGPIHFVGIGGIGMSGIAEVLKNLGYAVQGSDGAERAMAKRLAA